MPTYLYRCEGCRRTYTVDHSIMEPPRVLCPACEQPRLRRLIAGNTSFVLKGRGWARDNYTS